MLTSGLTNAPISKTLLIYTIASSIALAILDLKHLTSIHVVPHIWQYGQFWRILVWQVAGFANSTEALFAAMLAYHLRVVERGWGGRKFATFLLTTLPYTTLLPPLILILVLKPLSLGTINYLPSGPVATIFALLAQYHASVPRTFTYRVSTSTSAPTSTTITSAATAATATATDTPSTSTSTSTAATTTPSPSQSQSATPSPFHSAQQPKPTSSTSLTLLLSDKSTTYLVAAQLALSQFPGMLLPAAVGWCVGWAWRMEVLPLPGLGGTWRVPAWVVGEKERGGNSNGNGNGGAGGAEGRYEDLRRRLEGEAVAARGASQSGADVGGGSGMAGRMRRGGG
ncbi:hypothetical protein BO70DRAFT_332559 [Aspergillus heteromorphus CBS 117.55]|uniref:UBA domain-containing protein Ucp14 n=1 Tax=Aspergillus heteromorphus CBS 117.55 TaxID=1448321 RepID=A0A317WM71_9EURO|nr:uncharacterized protein BO70DRAFT_332559 [Aspergillus heteromorphus CBS 117.55]PWY87564.1 hypothetical protein BO70DRAFT_332559 [Aspergillus heteromorphus CBS 117.55]